MDSLMAGILSRGRGETLPDQWQAQIMIRVLQKARVIYISDAPDALVRSLHMVPAHSLEEAMALASDWAPAGAAVAGAILGVLGGEETIPEYLLEELECAEVLRELAGDLFGGCPMMKGSRIFDVEWDEKYNSADL